MQQPPFEISAARALVDQLQINGVERAYCVPGESYLSVLDACYERGLPLTVCRNEAGAAMMADAYGKTTGKPGICFVTRGQRKKPWSRFQTAEGFSFRRFLFCFLKIIFYNLPI